MSNSLSDFIENLEHIGSKMNEKMSAMNDECRAVLTKGAAAGGLVQVEVNGLGEVITCKIDPSLFSQGDAELVEDLIVTAANEALASAKEKQMELMQNAAETIDMPGLDSLKDMFGKK